MIRLVPVLHCKESSSTTPSSHDRYTTVTYWYCRSLTLHDCFPFKRLYSQLTYFNFKKHIFWESWKPSAVSTACLNAWNSTLQAAWYITHVRIIRFLWTKPTIWLLILSFTQNIVHACSSRFHHEGYRSVTHLDAARVNRTIFHNQYVHWYYITLIKGRDYIKHDMNITHGKQNPRRGRRL